MPHHAVSRWRFALSPSHTHSSIRFWQLLHSEHADSPPLPHLNPQLSKFTSRQQKVQSCKAAFHCHIKVRISWVHCNKIYIWNMGLSYLPCPKPFCKAWAGLVCLCRVSTSRGSLREFQGILCKVKLLNLSAFYQEKSGQWHYTITPLCNIFFSYRFHCPYCDCNTTQTVTETFASLYKCLFSPLQSHQVVMQTCRNRYLRLTSILYTVIMFS